MTIKKFGFFDESPESEAVQRLESLKNEGPLEDEQKVLKYLRSGAQLMAVAGVVDDLLASPRETIGSPHVFSDGSWCWTADVIYYVENHHIAVPDEFLSHMRANDCNCPEVANKQELIGQVW